MRVALAIPGVTPHVDKNIQKIYDFSVQAAQSGATAIFFSEAAITGFINTGDPLYDRTLGYTVPGQITAQIGQVARSFSLWVGIGVFEQDSGKLYDTYVVLSPQGTIETKYRRIDNHWHHWHSRPCNDMIYAEGEQISASRLPIGTTTYLLCGDLFNDAALEQVKQLHPDWLVVPMARGYDSEVSTAEQWYAQERYYYVERSRAAGVNLLLVNQLANWDTNFTYFGGAMAVTKEGIILNEYPLEQEGILYIDIN
ncbi:carbon-nitrogen hydrolase family protein [Calidithermus chliarophilus]|uniref:carbon-nitrogen hydrolase family protein n=1 Tax=Calidithermus chliarophilus TaxID=52023 RepID=UPI0009FE4188|nr:carbon-nitrogen hydrolase family protein [Calidithermus chliarophilus]